MERAMVSCRSEQGITGCLSLSAVTTSMLQHNASWIYRL